jgi:phosphate-selective porin OprO and OprP
MSNWMSYFRRGACALSQARRGFWVALMGSGLCLSSPVIAQTAKPTGFTVPEWKSKSGDVIVRARVRALHDFYSIERDFDAGSINGTTENNDTRAIRMGIDGQFSKTVKFRADANLVNGDVNWADVYLGYTNDKVEFFVGQHRLSTALETASSATIAPLPEPSLITITNGQNLRNFGAIARVKGENWQVVGGLYTGNLNAGDIFGDDVIRYGQVRGTYALRAKERDVFQIGASVRVRDAQGGPLLRYSTRPAATNFGARTLDSGAVARDDITVSLEAALVKGSLIVTAEHQITQADTLTGTASLNGSYVEGAWYLTGESRRYSVSSASFGGIRPKKSVRAGGPGAIGLVARLERLDQSDSAFGTRAGSVGAISVGAVWHPVDYVMFRLAAAHSDYSGPVAARNGTANVIMARAQFSF